MIRTTTFLTADCDACRVWYKGESSGPATREILLLVLGKAGWIVRGEKCICARCVDQAAKTVEAIGVDSVYRAQAE